MDDDRMFGQAFLQSPAIAEHTSEPAEAYTSLDPSILDWPACSGAIPENVSTESECGLQERTVMPRLINPVPVQPVDTALSAMEAQAHSSSGVGREVTLPFMTSALPAHTTASSMEVETGTDFESDGTPLSLNSTLAEAGLEATFPSMVPALYQTSATPATGTLEALGCPKAEPPSLQQQAIEPFDYQKLEDFLLFNSGLRPSDDLHASGLISSPSDLTNQDHQTNKKRFRVVLNAPAATRDEPLTYLNKGQTYTITVSDTHQTTPSPIGLAYCMVVEVLFSDKERRGNSTIHLQEWKDAQEPAECQMIKYIGQSGNRNIPFQIQRVRLNGFSGTWMPEAETVLPECSINVNFRFRSSEFSSTRGTGGVPFRLNVKTMVIPGGAPETRYRTVKLYRENGAERQNSNDMKRAVKRMERTVESNLSISSRDTEKSRQMRKHLKKRLKVLNDMIEFDRVESLFDMVEDPEDDLISGVDG